MMHKESILRVNSPVDQEQNCWKALVEGHSLPSVSMLHFISLWKLLSCVWLVVTPWAIQSMEFSRPEYWNG